MSSTINLSLTTSVQPAAQFTVDGEPYDLLGLEHLSTDAEHEIAALFARHNAVALELSYGPAIDKGKQLAERIERLQNRIIEVMTSMPADLIKKLPQMEKAKLFETVVEKYEARDDAAPAPTTPEGDVAQPALAVSADEL